MLLQANSQQDSDTFDNFKFLRPAILQGIVAVVTTVYYPFQLGIDSLGTFAELCREIIDIVCSSK